MTNNFCVQEILFFKNLLNVEKARERERESER
jgi:hypothetical protein